MIMMIIFKMILLMTTFPTDEESHVVCFMKTCTPSIYDDPNNDGVSEHDEWYLWLWHEEDCNDANDDDVDDDDNDDDDDEIPKKIVGWG